MVKRAILKPGLTARHRRRNFVKTRNQRSFLNRLNSKHCTDAQPLLLSGLLSLLLLLQCAPPEPTPRSGLTDERFADLFVEVYRFHQRHPGRPDSLSASRQQAFRQYGVTPGDLQRFMDSKKTPDAWQPVLLRIREKLGKEVEVKPGTWLPTQKE